MKGSFTMKFSAKIACIGILFLIVFTVPAVCEEIQIQISPSTLNLAYQGTVVTVHTDIAYSSVAGATVTLGGIPIAWWKSDNQGNFVAKFNSDEVKALYNNNNDFPATETLTLTGETTGGSTFSGSGEITVIQVTGKK
jgi:hypothetical protein